MKNNNIASIVPLWDLESFEDVQELYVIEYDEEEFIEHEDNEDKLSLYERMAEGERFKPSHRNKLDNDRGLPVGVERTVEL